VADAPFSAPADEVLDRQRAVLDCYPPGGLVTGWVTLVGHDLMSDALVAGASSLARARGVGLTFHLSPSATDPAAYLARTGVRPIIHLDRLDALGPHVLVAHGVHLDDDELDAVLATRTGIAACPWAYLRLGQGVTSEGRHAELVRRGGRVAIGCDSENAGDLVDPLRAAALFAGLAKDTRADPTWFGAHDALELLTISGAEAVGLGDLIGSIEPGKRADLVVHGGGPNWVPPGHDPALQLVWGGDGRSVRDVVIDGRVVVRDGWCVTVDADSLRDTAAEASAALAERAGISPTSRWPLVRPSDHC
jgi:5-methylthioadenosine/S-adenosylhomocysteine deaminase